MRNLVVLGILALSGCAHPGERMSASAATGAVTFHVLGLQKTPSGATWRGWPDKVSESLEGAHPSTRTEWNYDEDLVTIAFDPRETNAEELKHGIEALGYEAEQASMATPALSAAATEVLSVPSDAPAFFSEAIGRAKVAGKPLLIDFWAPWCGPCLKLRRETLESPELAGLLAQFEVIAVNLDEAPALGSFFRVTSIPCVLFVDPRGAVVDRLLGFEPPTQFRARLEKALPR